MWLASEQEFLQRERYGCAHLENFASGLELIGQKVFLLLLCIFAAHKIWVTETYYFDIDCLFLLVYFHVLTTFYILVIWICLHFSPNGAWIWFDMCSFKWIHFKVGWMQNFSWLTCALSNSKNGLLSLPLCWEDLRYKT